MIFDIYLKPKQTQTWLCHVISFFPLDRGIRWKSLLWTNTNKVIIRDNRRSWACLLPKYMLFYSAKILQFLWDSVF